MRLIFHGPESAVEDPDTLDPVTWRWRTRLATPLTCSKRRSKRREVSNG